MRYIKVAVCDDEENVIEIISSTIKSAFSKKGITADIEAFVTTTGLMRRMNDVVFELLFLDIDIPGMDGIAFGSKLREKQDMTEIVYVSNREDRVFEALSVRPFAFVRKSNFITDIAECVGRYIKHVSRSGGNALVLQGKGGIVNISIDEIKYFEGSGKSQLMYVRGKDQPFTVYRSMEKLEEELSAQGFIRIHKGILVNYKYISKILVGEVEMTDGTLLPLSRRKATDIKHKYLDLLSDGGSLII